MPLGTSTRVHGYNILHFRPQPVEASQPGQRGGGLPRERLRRRRNASNPVPSPDKYVDQTRKELCGNVLYSYGTYGTTCSSAGGVRRLACTTAALCTYVPGGPTGTEENSNQTINTHNVLAPICATHNSNFLRTVWPQVAPPLMYIQVPIVNRNSKYEYQPARGGGGTSLAR